MGKLSDGMPGRVAAPAPSVSIENPIECWLFTSKPQKDLNFCGKLCGQEPFFSLDKNCSHWDSFSPELFCRSWLDGSAHGVASGAQVSLLHYTYYIWNETKKTNQAWRRTPIFGDNAAFVLSHQNNIEIKHLRLLKGGEERSIGWRNHNQTENHFRRE